MRGPGNPPLLQWDEKRIRMSVYMCVCVYIYVYVCVCVYNSVYQNEYIILDYLLDYLKF